MIRLLSWNMAHRPNNWAAVLESEADVALLQEACRPPAELDGRITCDSEPWGTGTAGRNWRTCVAGLGSSVVVTPIAPKSLHEAHGGDFAVSCRDTLAAAEVRDPGTGETFVVLSMYAPWERPHPSTGGKRIYADGSVHRLISDLSVLIASQSGHRIIAAGDLNILRGYGDNGSPYWAARYQTVFDRMTALGLRFAGPEFPNGRQAEPHPAELPIGSRNIPTYHTNRQRPETATRQLDFVFASEAVHKRVTTRAMNGVEEWGASDHCRIMIEVR